uniref:Uncharacterized protein n=1 Tax=Anguilla anguilla TaxID=7936 RepID=A0A0E9VVX4_ANGAN
MHNEGSFSGLFLTRNTESRRSQGSGTPQNKTGRLMC